MDENVSISGDFRPPYSEETASIPFVMDSDDTHSEIGVEILETQAAPAKSRPVFSGKLFSLKKHKPKQKKSNGGKILVCQAMVL